MKRILFLILPTLFSFQTLFPDNITFISCRWAGQYHGWLAADTHGVLVFIPDYPILNVCFTTFVLVCLAHEVHVITGQLVNVAVPGDWQTVLRNILIFFLALLPIAIHHEGWLTL